MLDGRFEILGKSEEEPHAPLGVGSYGVVWTGRDLEAPRDANGKHPLVAVKVIDRAKVKGRKEMTLIKSEAKTLSQVDHPFVIKQVSSDVCVCARALAHVTNVNRETSTHLPIPTAQVAYGYSPTRRFIFVVMELCWNDLGNFLETTKVRQLCIALPSHFVC